jgi:hypothetical protein
MLAAAAVTPPPAPRLAQAERAAAVEPAALPRLAALLLGRNGPGDATRAVRLLEGFLRRAEANTRGSARLLLLLAREREAHATERESATLARAKAARAAAEYDKTLRTLRKELEEAREGREVARHEAIELRRKLRDLTSIERSMDERKGH